MGFYVKVKTRTVTMEKKPQKLEQITVSMQEIWKHTRPMVQKSKKAYSRKGKKRQDYLSNNQE